MAWVGSPAQSRMRPFLEYPFPRKSVVMCPKNMAEGVTRDMASSDWLKLAVLCSFRTQSVSKNKSVCDRGGARLQSDRSTFSSNSLLRDISISIRKWNDSFFVYFCLCLCHSGFTQPGLTEH